MESYILVFKVLVLCMGRYMGDFSIKAVLNLTCSRFSGPIFCWKIPVWLSCLIRAIGRGKSTPALYKDRTVIYLCR